MYRDGGLDEYVSDTAAGRPTPGGGSVSALAGALAASMSEMCANFTVKGKKFAAVQDTVREMLAELSEAHDALLDLVDADVAAYGAVSEALKMPRDSEDDKAARREAMETALRGALRPPLEAARLCARIAHVARRLVDIGNPNLITDVGVSAVLAEAACVSARFNVDVNLKYLGEEALSASLSNEMDTLCDAAREARAYVCGKVDAFLKKGK